MFKKKKKYLVLKMNPTLSLLLKKGFFSAIMDYNHFVIFLIVFFSVFEIKYTILYIIPVCILMT